MNNRIKELAKSVQCERHWTEEDIEKFAELLIRKCAQICFSESKGHDMAFGEHCGIVIKEHFGVE
jgi:hypothetical protein